MGDGKTVQKETNLYRGGNMKRRSGFTLIELLVVIIIVGILAAIAVPKYIVQRDKAKAVEAIQQIGVLSGEVQAKTDMSQTIDTLADLDYDVNANVYSPGGTAEWNYELASGTLTATYNGTGDRVGDTITYNVSGGTWGGDHPGKPE